MNKNKENNVKKVEAKEIKKVETKTSSFKKKKKVKKNITSGIAFVYSTFNNTIISIADENGNVVSWSSAGSKGFKGSRKSTPYDLYNQGDLKFYRLKTLRQCHIMVRDRQREGEYNANYNKYYR